MKGKGFFEVVFVLILCGVFYAYLVNSMLAELFFKPLVVLSLLGLMFVYGAWKMKANKTVIAGLTFSLLGDVLLIFQDDGTLFFILGLVSFLIAHIFYITYFLKQQSNRETAKKVNFIVPVFFLLCYGVGFYSSLYKVLGELKWPVLAYTIILLGMNVSALRTATLIRGRRYFIAGALLFTASDSLLAINKFLSPLPYAGIGIMSTYALAQYFITQGVLKKT